MLTFKDGQQVLSNSLSSLITAVVFKLACSSEASDLVRQWMGVGLMDIVSAVVDHTRTPQQHSFDASLSQYPLSRPCAISGGTGSSNLPQILIYAALG
jgi:hypothetical protein